MGTHKTETSKLRDMSHQVYLPIPKVVTAQIESSSPLITSLYFLSLAVITHSICQNMHNIHQMKLTELNKTIYYPKIVLVN